MAHIPLLGHLAFPSSRSTITWTLLTSCISSLLPRPQTNTLTRTPPWQAVVPAFPTDLRALDVSDGPSLPSVWRCTETLPSPLWPSSRRWGWWDCSVAASGPHRRPASAVEVVRHTPVWEVVEWNFLCDHGFVFSMHSDFYLLMGATLGAG